MAIQLDNTYNLQQYDNNVNYFKALGFNDKIAANYAASTTANNLQYDAGELPEVTVTATRPYVHYIKDDNRPGVTRVKYNAYQGHQNELEAQKAANGVGAVIGGAMVIPALGYALGESALLNPTTFNLLSEGVTKASKYMNTLMPGTPEFMSIYNAGKTGKMAALGLTGLEAANEAGALDSFIKTPNLETGAMAALGASPAVGSGLKGFGKIGEGVLNLASRSIKPVRDTRLALATQFNDFANYLNRKYIRAKKWVDAPNRWQHLANQAKLYSQDIQYIEIPDLENYIRKLQKISSNATTLSTDTHNSDVKLQDLADNANLLSMYARDHNLLVKRTEPFYRDHDVLRFEIDPDANTTIPVYNRRHRFTTNVSQGNPIDLSQLDKESMYRMAFKRIVSSFDPQGYESASATQKADGLERFKQYYNLYKDNYGNWIIEQTSPTTIVPKAPFSAPDVVSTHYVIRDFSDLDKIPLEGDIRFTPSWTSSQEVTEVANLNLRKADYNTKTIQGYSTGQDPNQLESLPAEYVAQLQSNIAELQKIFPGFKPFGSASGVTGAGLPHATHDIDGMMTESQWNKWLKANSGKYRIDQTSSDTYKVYIADPNKYGDEVGIDINVLRANKSGNITGMRALELYRQLFPQEYSIATAKAIVNKSDISNYIRITPEELLNLYDPAIKTIADNFEINPFLNGNKVKQLGRPYAYISYGDPEVVGKGLQMFARANGQSTMFPATLEELGDIEQNKRILQQIGMLGDLNAIASDPKRMKNALDWWYINTTGRMRGVDANPQTFDPALREWLGDKSWGGNSNGAGLNTVSLGDSGYGSVMGMMQLQPGEDLSKIQSIEDRIAKINRFTGQHNYQFTPDEKQIIKDIAQNLGQPITRDFSTPRDLLTVLPAHTSETKQILQEINDRLGIRSLGNGFEYADGMYFSTTGKVPQDVPMMYQLRDRNVGSSNPVALSIRESRMKSNANNANNPDVDTDLHDAVQYIDFTKRRSGPTSQPSYAELDFRLETPEDLLKVVELRDAKKIVDSKPAKYAAIRMGKLDDYNRFKTYINELVSKVDNAHDKLNNFSRASQSIQHKKTVADNKLREIRQRNVDIKEISRKTALAAAIGATPGLAAYTLASVDARKRAEYNYNQVGGNFARLNVYSLNQILQNVDLSDEERDKIQNIIEGRKQKLSQIAKEHNWDLNKATELDNALKEYEKMYRQMYYTGGKIINYLDLFNYGRR